MLHTWLSQLLNQTFGSTLHIATVEPSQPNQRDGGVFTMTQLPNYEYNPGFDMGITKHLGRCNQLRFMEMFIFFTKPLYFKEMRSGKTTKRMSKFVRENH